MFLVSLKDTIRETNCRDSFPGYLNKRMETVNSFGYWVRRQRKALDLTQQALAERVGCSLAAIKKIEQDERRPSQQIASLLADVLGVPTSQREIFLEVARGIRPVDQLSLTQGAVVSTLPTGLVTFLFTDIEASTKLAQEHPEEWETLRARHHTILRETIEARNGYVFQVIGDAFCAAFGAPKDGLQAAVQAQRKLQTENWGEVTLKIRMGIHTGEAELHVNEYRGYLTLSLVQRLMSAGHGGQILLSHATKNLLSGHLPKDVSLLDLGEHKFKDILQPVRVFQVIAPDLQKEFPALHARDAFPNNLPIQLTSFIGREKEIQEAIRLFKKARLVTFTGPGGTGKTRLAIQVANELLNQYPDGVWMVELAPILDPLLVPRTTAFAIGLREEPYRPVIDMLCDYLREKKMLLLLDNCEHLIEVCVQMADTLLHACHQVHILATSREALGIAGETLYLVPSLTRPDTRNLPALDALKQYEAIQLFIDRATSAVPSFTLTNKNAFSIAHICQRLDGIPLAIELVATKIRVLSPGQIAQRLDDRFHLLLSGSRTALPRHQTLQAAIDWSYNLLSPGEQTLFRRLSVFLGGWTLEIAESVCPDGDTTNRDALKTRNVLDLLTQLVNKSLVMTQEQNGEIRYHMLEAIRQFGSDKLLETNESESLGDRHLEYFLQLAETAAPHLIRPEQVAWLDRLEAEHDNLCAALGWSLGKERPECALRLAASLGTFWNIHCHWKEGAGWLENALAIPMEDPTPSEKAARARALYQQAELANRLDDIERMKYSAELSLALAHESAGMRDISIARFYLGYSLNRHGGNKEAHPLVEQSFADFRELNDSYWQAYSYQVLSKILEIQGKLKFTDRIVQSLALAQKAGERLVLAEALWDYSTWLYVFNNLDEAIKYAKEVDLTLKQIGSSGSIASNLFAEIAWMKGEYQQATSYYLEIEERFRLLGEKNLRSIALANLGLLAIEQGDLDQAQAYSEQALRIARKLDNSIETAYRLAELGSIFYLQKNMERCKRNFREIIPLTREFSIYQKNRILLVTLMHLYVLKPKNWAHILGAIDNSQKESERPITPLWKYYFARAKAHVREALGDATFELELAGGQDMTLDEALEELFKMIEAM